ncbi:hypothetical protein WJX84_004054 [Apatococcus fuscideae]|uniref:peptidylprolyl isomerase n=1 Tax=Apatococcus fuscideae TaxID=2026836 RepID=A0AAW1SUJ9_9CHLO
MLDTTSRCCGHSAPRLCDRPVNLENLQSHRSFSESSWRPLRPAKCCADKPENQRAFASPPPTDRLGINRRQVVELAAGAVLLKAQDGSTASAAEPKYETMDALKGKDYGKARTKYPDYTMTESGLQYQDLRPGSGQQAQSGSLCEVDWDGYTIGYYGRPFEARNKPKGSSFTGDDKDFFKFTLGDHSVIPAFEEAVSGMKIGGIRRIVVPPEIGYPDNDFRKQGPVPTTFSGKRTLDFVLKNHGMIDKTLLFDIELIKIL